MEKLIGWEKEGSLPFLWTCIWDQQIKLFRIGAGVLSVGVTLFVLQMMLTILATVPLAIVQNSLENSFVAKHIIQSVPITSHVIKQLWVTKIIG